MNIRLNNYIAKSLDIKLNKEKHTRGEIIYAIAFGMFMLSTLYETTEWGLFNDTVQSQILILTKLMRYGCYSLCLLKMLLEAIYERSRLVLFGMAAGLLVLSYLSCSNITLVLYFTMFIAAEGVESRWIIKIAVLCQAVILFVTAGMAQIGIIDNRVWDPTVRPRYFMGFSWVTTSAILFLFIVFEYIYLKKGILNVIEYIVGIIIAYWLYKMSDARMTFLISILVLTFFLVFGKMIANGKLTCSLEKIFIFVPFILGGFAMVMQYIYTPSSNILVKINDFLTGRLKWGRSGIDEYGLHLFGSPIEWVGYDSNWKNGMKYNYVDSSYLQIALEYGLVVLTIILILYALLIYTSIKNGNYYLCWIVMIILVFCITEPRLVKLAYNPFLLLAVTESIEYIGKKHDHEKTEIVNS